MFVVCIKHRLGKSYLNVLAKTIGCRYLATKFERKREAENAIDLLYDYRGVAIHPIIYYSNVFVEEI